MSSMLKRTFSAFYGSPAPGVGMRDIGRDDSPYAHFIPSSCCLTRSDLRLRVGIPTFPYHPYRQPLWMCRGGTHQTEGPEISPHRLLWATALFGRHIPKTARTRRLRAASRAVDAGTRQVRRLEGRCPRVAGRSRSAQTAPSPGRKPSAAGQGFQPPLADEGRGRRGLPPPFVDDPRRRRGLPPPLADDGRVSSRLKPRVGSCVSRVESSFLASLSNPRKCRHASGGLPFGTVSFEPVLHSAGRGSSRAARISRALSR